MTVVIADKVVLELNNTDFEMVSDLDNVLLIVVAFGEVQVDLNNLFGDEVQVGIDALDDSCIFNLLLIVDWSGC